MKIITRVSENIKPYWWQGHCYFDHAHRKSVMAPIGLHLVIRVWWGFWLWYSRWAWGACFLDETLRRMSNEMSVFRIKMRRLELENIMMRSELLNLQEKTGKQLRNFE